MTLANGLRAAALLLLVLAWWPVLRHGARPGVALALTVAIVVAALLARHGVQQGRRLFIDTAPLPRHLRHSLLAAMPNLSEADAVRAEQALRQFFRVHLGARRELAMPSQAADALWHAFILDTLAYARFCQRAFGRTLHHRPAETLGSNATRNDALRRTWYRCCRDEGVDPRQPLQLPLLFALDAAISFPGGFLYVPDCGAVRRADDGGNCCGTAFGDGSAACGDADGFGGECGDGGGSDGGGDGGDGGGGDGGGGGD